MSVLQDFYPGDRALEFFLIVALGVIFLSTAAWVVAWRLPKKPATRHLVLASALFGCLALPVMATAFSAWRLTLISIPLLPSTSNETESSVAPAMPVSRYMSANRLPRPTNGQGVPVNLSRPDDGKPENDRRATAATTPRPVSAQAELPQQRSPYRTEGFLPYRANATLVLMVWGCGTAVLLLRFARSWLLVCRLGRSSIPVRDVSLLRLIDDVGRALGIRRVPHVYLSPRVSTPLALGARRPIVVLPDRLIGAVSDEEMRDVLLHEMAHVSRRDPAIVLLQELARATYWPLVPVHALIRELSRAREELCDNHVLRGRNALSYGATLLHLAELSQKACPLVAGVGIVCWRGELERRIAGLLDQGRSTMTTTNRWLVCLVALLFVAGGTIAASTRLSARGEQFHGITPKPLAEVAPKSTAAANTQAQKQPKRSMLIQVVGPDGRPMAGVKLHRAVWTRKPNNKGNNDYVSDERGHVRMAIPEGIYIVRLWARAKGYVPLFAGWEEEDHPETTLPAEFTFQLKPGTVIGGAVRDVEGAPIKGVAVEVMLERGGRAEGRTGPDMWLATDPGTAPITDNQGTWTLDNVPPGNDLELRLKLSHSNYISDPNWGSSQEQQGIDLKALRARTATITMRGGLVATGTVTDAAGKPISGAVVVRGDHPYWEVGSQEVRTDEHGRYRLPPLPSGKVTITVVAPGWMPVLTKVDIRQGMSPFDFQLQPGRDLQIRIVDQAGKPVPGVGVAIDNWRGGESLYNHRHPNVLDTRIPIEADESGLYRWTWAPDDAVTFKFFKEGYARHQASLTASANEQTVTLPKVLRITGKVTDTAGRPVKGMTAVPVIEFRPDNLVVERNRAKGPFDGTYTVETDRTDLSYRVRIEASGYRTAMSETARAGIVDPSFDLRLETAPPLEGRLVDSGGQGVNDARVYLATQSQNLENWPDDANVISFNQKAYTDRQGRFSFPAQFEPYAVVAVHDRGYAEVHLEPSQQPGELTLKNWARIDGRLLHAGQPTPSASISFAPVRLRNGASPHIHDHFMVKTDRDGRFEFPRVPPVKSHVSAQLSVWRDYPFSSSESVPLDLQPGEKAHLDLGGKGTVVKGRVVLSGDAAPTIDLHKSLNWLLRRAPGIEPPAEVRLLGLNAGDGWNNAWTATSEGRALIDTLHTYFVVLDRDGRLQISGVPAGDYDLALRLYEPPGGGCLVSPVGSRIVRFKVTEEAAREASLDLGDIPITVAIGPRTGDMAPDLSAATISGGTVKLSSLRGQYVLLDFWATWCGPCVANLPALFRFHDTFAADNRVRIVGLNLDDDPAETRAFVEARKLSWTQAHLGGRDGDKVDILSRYAVSSIPTYILIGPDGKLIHRGGDLDEIAKVLPREPR